ncbi:phage holin family protein [Flavobacterium sp. FZUC8N2.13]|uniref:Phage holin family protein n=1 Tax=Flavobacterium zubiriense TaxID=3138075 RepID=A0ABV4TCG5_9FLAO
MNILDYLLKGFGYENKHDFATTVFKILYVDKSAVLLFLSGCLGTIRLITKDFLGLDAAVFFSLIFLVCAEVWTGTKVSVKIKGDRVQSRKIGRMILKIGVFTSILYVLHSFSSKMECPTVLGLEVNPYEWLYYVVFTSIVFQLVISWLENLAALGYSEARGLIGILLRKYNKWFEFDGTKNPYKNE